MHTFWKQSISFETAHGLFPSTIISINFITKSVFVQTNQNTNEILKRCHDVLLSRQYEFAVDFEICEWFLQCCA